MPRAHGNTSLKAIQPVTSQSFQEQRDTHHEQPLLLETGLMQVREAVVQYRQLMPFGESIREARHIPPLFWKIAPNNVQEHFAVFCLNSSHAVTTATVMFSGTANMAFVHPREIFQLAVLAGAISVIVAHNHPSGDLTPSEADKETTRRLKKGGEILGIKLLDHILVSETDFASAEAGGWI